MRGGVAEHQRCPIDALISAIASVVANADTAVAVDQQPVCLALRLQNPACLNDQRRQLIRKCLRAAADVATAAHQIRGLRDRIP